MTSELSEDDAARKIQRAWRRHADVALFRKLKSLVTFRNQGDPATLLKVINPLEAQLLDPAVGAHVRFRLGGFEWPPQIYYKIFLHSPVCDVNSYAPRNYSDRRNAEIGPVSPEDLPELSEKFGWYKRIENNGWRPISSLSPTAIDMITQMTNRPKVKTTAPKIRARRNIRREVAKMKLQRYIQMQEEQGVPEGEHKLTEADIDDEEIMRWVDEVDMSQYLVDWETIGTTGPSSNIWWNQDDDEEIADEEESSESELDEEELMRLIS